MYENCVFFLHSSLGWDPGLYVHLQDVIYKNLLKECCGGPDELLFIVIICSKCTFFYQLVRQSFQIGYLSDR